MRTMLILWGLLLHFLTTLAPYSSNACTTFCLQDGKGNILFGKNYDFPTGLGHIHVNYRNQEKTAFALPGETAISWVSKYGSITFNQVGKEFPHGGMNEAGLIIELMWHQDARYPENDDRFGLSELQWIQYQLDNSASVEDVLKSDRLLRISSHSVATIHMLIADAAGNVATIEYLDGELVCHTGEGLVYPVLANCTYDISLEYKMNREGK